jgi:hypothetical protein
MPWSCARQPSIYRKSETTGISLSPQYQSKSDTSNRPNESCFSVCIQQVYWASLHSTAETKCTSTRMRECGANTQSARVYSTSLTRFLRFLCSCSTQSLTIPNTHQALLEPPGWSFTYLCKQSLSHKPGVFDLALSPYPRSECRLI